MLVRERLPGGCAAGRGGSAEASARQWRFAWRRGESRATPLSKTLCCASAGSARRAATQFLPRGTGREIVAPLRAVGGGTPRMEAPEVKHHETWTRPAFT